MNPREVILQNTLRTAAVALALGIVFSASESAAAEGAFEGDSAAELQVRWQYFQPIRAPEDAATPLADVVLGPRVFTHARSDLADLRIYDKTGATVPYAFRILRPRRDTFAAKEFNRAEGAGGARELSLDLERDDVEHNQVEIDTPGVNFRRRVEVEGSADAAQWSLLAKTNLIRFERGDQKLDDNAVTYPPSRFRFLRIRVFPDPVVDDEPWQIGEVQVAQRVALPDETLTLPGQLGPREPVRADGGPGSAWIIDLGGNNVPCEEIEVEIDDAEFARNFHFEAAGPPDEQTRFSRVSIAGERLWQRRLDDPKRPMVARFHREVRAARLKLVVTDSQNPPLRIRAVRFRAPVRQVVFALPEPENAPLQLFFGNPDAEEAPNYDFARNLPSRLIPPPARAELETLLENPAFTPPPKPLTDRWPWLIYAVLGAVSLTLAAIIINLARTAIALHDNTQEPTQTTSQEASG